MSPRMTARRYQDPTLRQTLAAEYALGTLTGPARRRFERLLAADPSWQEEVRFWNERLAEFAQRLPPVAPDAALWTRLERAASEKVRVLTPRARPPTATPARWLLPLWAAAATVAAVALGLGLARQNAAIDALQATVTAQQNEVPPYVAVLQPAGGDARWAITLHPEKRRMRVRFSGTKMPADVSQRSLELWMLDSKGQPHSLGLLPVVGRDRAQDLPLPEMPASELGAGLTLAISEEPRGGSPTGLPTGKVLGAFTAVKPI